MYCAYCGNKIEDGAKFCGHCGHPIERAGQTSKFHYSGSTSDGKLGAVGTSLAQSVGQLNRSAEKLVPHFLRNMLPKVPALCFAAAYVLILVCILGNVFSGGGKLSGYTCYSCGDQRSEHYYTTGYGNNVMCEDCASLYWLVSPGAKESHRIY